MRPFKISIANIMRKKSTFSHDISLFMIMITNVLIVSTRRRKGGETEAEEREREGGVKT